MADDDWGDDQESGGSSKKKSKEGGDEDWNEGGGEDDGWGAGGGWEGGEMTDPEADTGGFVSSTAKGKGVKKIGIKLYVDLAKQVMLAIRNKKTGSDHFDDASALIQELYKEYMDQQSEKVADQKKKDKEKGKSATAGKSKEAPKGGEKKKTGNKECMICFSAFDDSEAFPATMTNCGHSTGCTNCFMKYLQNKIKEKDVTPWLCCMEEKCYQPLHHEDISGSGIVTLEMYQLADAYLRKMLVRNENWVPCSTKDCGFGFLVEGKVGTKLEGSMCGVCGTKQTVEKKEVGLDEEMKKMIKEGKLRACPICKLWTMKEYGLCNIIQCGKCAIWWNWRTNLTGKSSRDLKDKARADGSLWEPGELAYQQNLEATNPKAFKELLERNGMKYDPNYRRGGQKADED